MNNMSRIIPQLLCVFCQALGDMEESILQEIGRKYLKEEKLLEENLKKCEQQRTSVKNENILNSKNFRRTKSPISNEAAAIRNQKLLKDAEIAQARLRTLTLFSPTDLELQDCIAAYKNHINQRK